MNDMMSDTICKYIGLIGIIAIELYALSQGVNGIAISVSVGAIAGILGIKVGQKITEKEFNDGKRKTKNN